MRHSFNSYPRRAVAAIATTAGILALAACTSGRKPEAGHSTTAGPSAAAQCGSLLLPSELTFTLGKPDAIANPGEEVLTTNDGQCGNVYDNSDPTKVIAQIPTGGDFEARCYQGSASAPSGMEVRVTNDNNQLVVGAVHFAPDPLYDITRHYGRGVEQALPPCQPSGASSASS